MSQALVPGSLGAVSKQSGQSLAESLMNAEILVLVDISYSMNTADSRGGRSRWQVAGEELSNIQAAHPGKIAMVAFSSSVQFVPSGILPPVESSTDLAGALRYVHQFDGTMRFIVVSDGQPDDEQAALAEARRFTSRIDCIYCGPEVERSGALFLAKLAHFAGGQFVRAEKAMKLADKIETVLLIGGR